MKKSITRIAVIFQLIILITFFFSSCEKNYSDSPDPITPSGETVKTTVTGRVTDTNGNIMSGVTVKIGSITTVSDTRGYFLFVDADVQKDRFVLIASKSGFFNCIRGKKTQDGDANYINLMMEELPAVVNIQSAAGGVVNIQGGATITFPANAFVDQSGNAYSGQVKVYARHFSPGAANFEAILPGGDLLAVNTLGEEQSLYSLGMIEAKLYDNSGVNEIKLATGITAALKFPIDPSQNAVALSTIPLWHLDETTGIWQEEGQATKSGNFYIGNVSHFSIWNCDFPFERADIKGLVVDCQNNPMSNVVVTIAGFQNVTTDNFGIFTTWVPAGYPVQYQVLQVFNPTIFQNSAIQNLIAVAGQINYVPTINISCASRIMGYIKTCDGSAPSSALIYISANGFDFLYYSATGYYEFNMPANTSIRIVACSGSFKGELSIMTGGLESIINVPDIPVCNSNNQPQEQFYFTLNNGQPYLIDNPITNALFTDVNSDGTFESVAFTMLGTTVPGNHTCSIQIGLYEEINGYYSLYHNSQNNMFITIDSIGSFGNGNYIITTLNRIEITDYGVPGGFMTGNFEFNYASGSSATITDGYFSFAR